MENHNWTQPANQFTGGIQQIYQNPNAPFINSLVNGTAYAVIDGSVVNISEQVAYATNYTNVLATAGGNNPHIHPSEPNYIWAEAGSNFGVLNDADPFVSGNNQTDTILATLAQPLSVKVTDTFGNAVPQQPVDFQVTSGQAGLLTGGSTTTQALVHASTDANGVAQATLRLGTLAGIVIVSASAVQTTTAPVTFTTTIRPGLPKSLVVQAGNGQTAIVGTLLATAASVVVKDAGGNPTPGVAVTFTTSPSSGTVSTGTTFCWTC